MKEKFFNIVYVLIFLCVISGNKVSSQVLPADSLALVEFYWAANGPTWYNDSNWLITNVEFWYGVSLSTDYGNYTLPTRVYGLNLANNNLNGTIHPLLCQLDKTSYNFSWNNLTGAIPPCIGNCELSALYLGHNQLTNPIPLSLGNDAINNLGNLFLSYNNFFGHFPDTIIKNTHIAHIWIDGNHFSSIGNLGNVGLNIQLQENNFTFKDLIPYKNNLLPLAYMMPQDSVLESLDTIIPVGSTFSMDAWVDTCSGNRYTWYKNGNWINWNSPVSAHTISNAQPAHSGYYTCQLSNPTQCSGVYLWRRTIKLTVSNSTGLNDDHSLQNNCSIKYRLNEQTLDISFNFPGEEQVSCNLYDETGRIVLRLYNGNTTQQDFHHYLGWMKSGIYIAKVETKSRMYTKKICVY